MNIRDVYFILSKIQFTLSKQIYNESESTVVLFSYRY